MQSLFLTAAKPQSPRDTCCASKGHHFSHRAAL